MNKKRLKKLITTMSKSEPTTNENMCMLVTREGFVKFISKCKIYPVIYYTKYPRITAQCITDCSLEESANYEKMEFRYSHRSNGKYVYEEI